MASTGKRGAGSALTDTFFTVTELARDLSVTPRTIRFYEDKALITPRRAGTMRVYTKRDRARMVLILRGKRLGFDLGEIRRIVDMYDQAPGEAGQLRYLLSQIGDRRADLEQRRSDLDLLLHELDELKRRCEEELAELG